MCNGLCSFNTFSLFQPHPAKSRCGGTAPAPAPARVQLWCSILDGFAGADNPGIQSVSIVYYCPFQSLCFCFQCSNQITADTHCSLLLCFCVWMQAFAFSCHHHAVLYVLQARPSPAISLIAWISDTLSQALLSNFGLPKLFALSGRPSLSCQCNAFTQHFSAVHINKYHTMMDSAFAWDKTKTIRAVLMPSFLQMPA